MATLIVSNYNSTKITSYGGMFISCGILKANTLYTLKCRYKYTKNTSTRPQILCYNSDWVYGGNIYDATDDGIMKTRTVKFTSHPSEKHYEIGCYAWSYDDQNNGGGKTGVLEVDWYELWEGDATEFSLTDAYRKGTTNLFKHGANPTSLTGIGNNGANVTLDSTTFGYNVYKCVSTVQSTQMYIMYNSAALSSALETGKTYLATAEVYSPDSSWCYINIEQSNIIARSNTLVPNQWTRVWVIGTRTANAGAVTFYDVKGTYYYKNIHIAETPTSFVELQQSCVNPGYFSSVEPIWSLRAWWGYHFSTGYNISVSLSSTSVAASGGTITVTYTIKDKNTNAGVSGVTPAVSSTLGTVSNITATNSSGVGTAKVTINSLGTTLKTANTDGKITVTKNGTAYVNFHQVKNRITEITSITPSAGTLNSPATYTAAQNTKTVTTNTNSSCSAVVKFESGSSATTSHNSTTYGTWNWKYSWSSNQSYATLTSASSLNMDVTMTSRGTTKGAARSATITRTCAWTYTVAAGNSSTGSALTKSGSKGCTATVTQQANAANAYYKDLVVGLSYAATAPSTTSKTVAPSLSVKATPCYTSGSAGTQIAVPSSGYTVIYSESTASSYASVNSSTGVITWNSNSKVTSNRTVGITASVTCTRAYSSLTGAKAVTATHTKDTATYGNPTGTLTYPTAAWNSSSAGTYYTPTLTVSQVKTWASGAKETITPTVSSKTWTANSSGSAVSLRTTDGGIKFMADNFTTSQRTGYTITATFTANSKTGTASASPKQAGYPLSIDAYQVGYSGSTTSGGGTIPVGSYAYFYVKITNTGGSAVNTITWSPKRNSGYGTIGGQYSTSYMMYNNGRYSSDEITCTVKLANGVTVSDVVDVSLITGPDTGGTGGGDSSNDSSNWSLRKAVDNEESNTNEVADEQNT